MVVTQREGITQLLPPDGSIPLWEEGEAPEIPMKITPEVPSQAINSFWARRDFSSSRVGDPKNSVFTSCNICWDGLHTNAAIPESSLLL